MARSLATARAALRATNRMRMKAQRARERIRSRSIAKMKKRKHILALDIKRKLERDQPLSEIERAYIKRKPRGQHKKYVESTTNHGFLKPNQISELDSTFPL